MLLSVGLRPLPGQSESAPPSFVVAKPQPTMRVFGEDDRQLVGDTTQLPWSAIGVVQSLWRKSNNMVVVSNGTGTLIGTRVVLTAGHCVYDEADGWADEVLFTPARNGTLEPFGHSYSIRNISQKSWVDRQDNQYDLAMIVLEQPLGEQTGYLSVSAQPESFFVNRNLNTAGYPSETLPGTLQYHAYGAAIDVQGGLLRHTIDSEPGQSGSAIWYYQPDTESRSIVAVLTGSREVTSGGQVVDSYNVGVYLNSTFVDWINETLTKYDTVVSQDTALTDSADPVPAETTTPYCGTGIPTAGLLAVTLAAALRVGALRRVA
jgi:V8-like Glu-specific endopeptidase